jgi:hypothetical protein
MSDAEWEVWRAAWQSKGGALPALVDRVGKEKRGIALSNVLFFGIIAFELVCGVFMVQSAGTVIRIAGWGLLLIVLAMSALFLRLQRGLRDATDTPEQMLHRLELGIVASYRAGQLVRWVGTVTCGFTLALGLASIRPSTPWQNFVPGLIFVLVMEAVFFCMPLWVERKNALRRAAIAAWRAELGQL